jgi:hypothetical protein
VTMNELAIACGQAIVATGGVLVALLLPGFALERLLWRRIVPGVGGLIVALPLGVGLTGLVGAVLLGFGWFVPLILAAVCVAASLAGIIPFARWTRTMLRDPLVLILPILVIPWVVTAMDPGLPPASTYQWYYWDLGRQLADAHGVPVSVQEYGQSVRWLPDYVMFSLVSEAYRALTGILGEASAMTWWRVPLAGIALAALIAVLRLWLSRGGALLGAALIAGSTLFLPKFNAYKPEAFGIILGLAALWLVVRGIRDRDSSLVLLGGVSIGLAVAVHAIAATLFAMSMVAAGIVEMAVTAERRRSIARLVGGAIVAFAIVVATGWALQGRVTVAGDALRPRLVDGVDPTWVYQLYSIGEFEPRPEPDPVQQVWGWVVGAWPDVDLSAPTDLWAVYLLGFGFILLLSFGSWRSRRGLLVVALTAAILAAVIAYFGLAFETYVPRHTGIRRLAQYLPLIVSMLGAFAIEGVIATVSRLRATPVPRALREAALAAGAVLLLLPAAIGVYRADVGISASGWEAFGRLRQVGHPTDVVLSNALTHGSIEMLTGLEYPLDGRQPFIEEQEFLLAANRVLRDAHDLFTRPRRPHAVLQRLGVRWALVADDPRTLGAVDTLGGSVETFAAAPGWVEEARWEGLALFRRETVERPIPAVEHRNLARRVLAAIAALAVLFALLMYASGWRPRRPQLDLAAARSRFRRS